MFLLHVMNYLHFRCRRFGINHNEKLNQEGSIASAVYVCVFISHKAHVDAISS